MPKSSSSRIPSEPAQFDLTPDAAWFATFRKRLRAWYGKHQRDLPWRKTQDPYPIWVSEIMLQQTQVATVIGYYERFLQRFPTVVDLAEAEEQEVLALWAGLGYYRRAKQLHLAAKEVCEQHAKAFPTDFEDVLSLPGIGRYTAGAITSFAYGQRQPILEANTIRTHSRLIGLRSIATTSASQQVLWDFAQEILPSRGKPNTIRELNQAVMELGSLVCIPDAPKCNACPVSSVCSAYEQGNQHQIPARKPKQKFEQQTHVMLLIECDGQWLLRQNEEGQWWAGLWDFPRCEIHGKLPTAEIHNHQDQLLARKLEEEILAQTGVPCTLVKAFHQLKHGVTKYRITLHCFHAKIEATAKASLSGSFRWLKPNSLADIPLTSTSRKVANLLSERD